MSIVTVELNIEGGYTKKIFDVVSVDERDEKYLKVYKDNSFEMIRHSFITSVLVEYVK